MKNLLKGFTILLAVFCMNLGSATVDLSLEPGDTATINANTRTFVTCGGSGNNNDCTESCQKWYDINTWVNGQWQLVPNCAFETKCSVLENGCMRRTECQQFASTNTWINGQWQTVVSCAGTQTTTSCR